MRDAHARTPPGVPIRAVHYDEVSGGPLDRRRLDALAPGRPVRVQHRSGALWVLSSAALRQVGLDGGDGAKDEDADPPAEGIERDAAGRPTGRLFRLDAWLGRRLANDGPARPGSPSAAVLASFGVTGVTDCTPTPTVGYYDTLAGAVRTGALPLTVAVTGGPRPLGGAPAPSVATRVR